MSWFVFSCKLCFSSRCNKWIIRTPIIPWQRWKHKRFLSLLCCCNTPDDILHSFGFFKERICISEHVFAGMKSRSIMPKIGSYRKLNPGLLAWATSCSDRWPMTTRQPPTSQLHRWYWMVQLHTWQPLNRNLFLFSEKNKPKTGKHRGKWKAGRHWIVTSGFLAHTEWLPAMWLLGMPPVQ